MSQLFKGLSRRRVQCETSPELELFEDKVQAVFNPHDPEDHQTTLSQCLDHNQALFWQQVWIAKFDLLLQLMAPSVYFDPYKVCAISQAPAQRLQHTLWLLWDDATLLNLLQPDLMEKLASMLLPSELLTTICELRKALFSSPPSL